MMKIFKVLTVLFCCFVFDSFSQSNSLFTKSFEESRKSLFDKGYYEIKHTIKYCRALTSEEIQQLENVFFEKKGIFDFNYIENEHSIEVFYLSYIDASIIEYLVESINVKYFEPSKEIVKILRH